MNTTTLIPVSILTGFLGAGKTTLLKRLLTEPQSQRWVIIENEFGPINIDHELLVESPNERIVEMSNGCLCCSIRGDLSDALLDLAKKRAAGELDFDRVLIETTGLAKPGPVIQTFFMDEAVVEHYLLDGVITVVDAKHAMNTLDKQVEAQQQVGVADRLLISKTDLVSNQELDVLQQRLRRMNQRAKMTTVSFGEASLTDIFDLQGFHMSSDMDVYEPSQECGHDHDHSDCGHDHHHHEHIHDENCGHPHHAHDEVQSMGFESDKPFDPARLEDFLAALLRLHGEELLRYKGVLYLKNVPQKVIFQGVHMLMASDLGRKWDKHEKKMSRVVFIGNPLPKQAIEKGLKACVA